MSYRPYVLRVRPQVFVCLALSYDGGLRACYQRFGGAWTGVVLGGHREAVCACLADCENVAWSNDTETALAGKHVSRFAYGANYVYWSTFACLRFVLRPDRVVGFIQGWAKQIVHACVYYGQGVRVARI